jgi:hypothetical protein
MKESRAENGIGPLCGLIKLNVSISGTLSKVNHANQLIESCFIEKNELKE